MKISEVGLCCDNILNKLHLNIVIIAIIIISYILLALFSPDYEGDTFDYSEYESVMDDEFDAMDAWENLRLEETK